jgi:hypothetical protein
LLNVVFGLPTDLRTNLGDGFLAATRRAKISFEERGAVDFCVLDWPSIDMPHLLDQ